MACGDDATAWHIKYASASLLTLPLPEPQMRDRSLTNHRPLACIAIAGLAEGRANRAQSAVLGDAGSVVRNIVSITMMGAP